MKLALTPAMLETAYEYMRSTPPFRGWKLPPAEEVEFHVTRHRDREGDHCAYRYRPEHVIRVSAYYIHATNPLLMVMGHEMIHMQQEMRRLAKPDTHNKDFCAKAARVCRIHGWDLRLFIGSV